MSTYEQTLDAQLKQLRAQECSRINREKMSGARPDRRELLRLLKGLPPGDVVTVTRIDLLACATLDLFAIVKRIVDAGGQFRCRPTVVTPPQAAGGRLMITVLGGLADEERSLAVECTRAGVKSAKKQAAKFVRMAKLTPNRLSYARKMIDLGITSTDATKIIGIGHATLYRALQRTAACDYE